MNIDPFASHLWFLYSMEIVYLLLLVFHKDKMIIPGFILAVMGIYVGHTDILQEELCKPDTAEEIEARKKREEKREKRMKIRQRVKNLVKRILCKKAN